MRVLLTGGSGFVGQNVIEPLIRRGASVHVLSRRPPDLDGTGLVTHTPCDLLDIASIRPAVQAIKLDAVLHLAWFVEHGAFWTHPQNRDWVNVSLALAEAAAESGARRFVGAGTCYEYDWSTDADCDEVATPLKPETLYARCKHESHEKLKALLHDRDIEFAWARLFFLYGPGEAPGRLVPSVTRALLKDERAKCSRGLAIRDFMDVRDCGEALAALTLSQVTGAINIASGSAVRVADIAHHLGEITGKLQLLDLGALPDRPGEPPRITASVGRMLKLPGLPAPRPLVLGLQDAVRYWASKRTGIDGE